MKSLPQARTLPQIQLLNWILRPLDFMEVNHQRYGDIFRVRGSLFDWVFLAHPEAIKYVLTHDNKEFSAPGKANQIIQPLVGDRSLFLLDGIAHRRQRQLVLPPFHGERLKVYGELIRDISQQVIAKLTPGVSFRAREVMQQVSMRVILQAVFGLYESDRYHRLNTLLCQRLDMVNGPVASMQIFFPLLRQDLGRWSPGHKVNQVMAEIDQLLYAEISDRRAHPDPSRTDILSLLLLATDEEGNGMSDQELRDELMTLLVAGHETTATAMAWALYWIHRQPEVRQKLLAELDAASPLDPQSLTKLPYLNAVCCETLRFYPVAMLTFARQVEEPVELMGYPLEPGEYVMPSIYLLHRREDLYPNPTQFRPERFLERQYGPFEFMPFGSGNRRCVGDALALYEMKIVLGTLLSACELTLVTDQPVQPQRRGITLSMKGGVEMVFQGQRQVSQPILRA